MQPVRRPNPVANARKGALKWLPPVVLKETKTAATFSKSK